MRTRLATICLCLALAAACTNGSPHVDTRFTGVVRDATSGDPIEGVEVRMEKMVCVHPAEPACLDWDREVSAGPVETAADGSYELVAPSEDDIGGLMFDHGAYELGDAYPWDESGESTVNHHEVTLERRVPGGFGALFAEDASPDPGVALRFQWLEPGLDDYALVLRAPGGGTVGEPEARQLYVEGDPLGDATVLWAGSVETLPSEGDSVLTYVDDTADRASAYEYAVYPYTSIGVYGDPVVASWGSGG